MQIKVITDIGNEIFEGKELELVVDEDRQCIEIIDLTKDKSIAIFKNWKCIFQTY